jgi:hypothetical protein
LNRRHIMRWALIVLAIIGVIVLVELILWAV